MDGNNTVWVWKNHYGKLQGGDTKPSSTNVCKCTAGFHTRKVLHDHKYRYDKGI